MTRRVLATHSSRGAFGGQVVLLLSIATSLVIGVRQANSAEEPASSSSFDPAQIRKGAQLAAIGNCAVCHTAQHGKPFAGGRAVSTPFGTIYSTNITPDPDTGIGKWSRTDFLRAMHDGVDRNGRHLYPAFPYDHFTRVTGEDVDAIYAFLKTRDAVRAEKPRNELTFPFNIRAAVGAWKLLYFKRGVFKSVSSESARWNRGAYLVDGLGHCGACHTPRNALGAEQKSLEFTGGESGGWHAPALNAQSPAPAPWTAERLYTYLRHGTDDVHDIAAGPMELVVHNLSQVPEEDVRAIAIYVASLGSDQTQKPRRIGFEGTGQAIEHGAAIYAAACGNCHDLGRQAPGGALQLSLSTSISMATPANLVRIIHEGIIPPEGEKGPWMPAFSGALTNRQITELVIYLRAHFGEKPAWDNVSDEVEEVVSDKSKK
jgi:mono/diheme cytochrome c family protein